MNKTNIYFKYPTTRTWYIVVVSLSDFHILITHICLAFTGIIDTFQLLKCIGYYWLHQSSPYHLIRLFVLARDSLR